MQKVEKILVPIDFSDESGAALRDAASLVGTRQWQAQGRSMGAHDGPRRKHGLAASAD